MRLSILVFSAIVSAVSNVQAAPSCSARKPTLYVFGDSLSDIGALKELTNGLVPASPYWEGRFSSGPVWNEYLALLLNYNLYNKAMGGSTSADLNSSASDTFGIQLPTVQDQVDDFEDSFTQYKQNKTRDQDIVVLEGGANDYFADAANLASGNLSVSSFADTLSTTVINQLEQLRNIGFKTIVVANIAAIQYSAMAIQTGEQKLASVTINTYNDLLASKTSAWAKTATDVKLIAMSDIGKFVEITTNSPSIINTLGLTNVTGSCIASSDSSSGGLSVSSFMDVQSASVCADPSQYYFFDSVHPAERIQRLYGYYSWIEIKALRQGTVFELNESNLLSIIKKYNLGTPAPKPAAI